MSDQFNYLFTPLKIGSIEVKNRLVCLPHSTRFQDDGRPTEQMVYYLAEKAKGGVGLIIFSSSSVDPQEGVSGRFHAFDERFIPDYKAIADAVHEHDTKIIAQVAHAGRSTGGNFSQNPRMAFSAIPCPTVREMPHEMDLDEIREMVQHFVRAACNMEAAGFDGVELHGAHGYLINQAMSLWNNQRNDEYGGSLENRLRFVNEVIDGIRSKVAPSFVLGLRISGDQLQPGGLTLEDMAEIAQILAATGKIDYFSVSFATNGYYILEMSSPLAPTAYMPARIREVVNIPVIASQRINDPVLAEKLLADGCADLVGMGRALICDPELPNKAKEGRLEDIRHCVACVQECWKFLTIPGRTIRCTQNATVGKEKEWGIGSIKPASEKKKVVIIGGGPAGMEAARVCALRGHEVTLYEKEEQLGGQVNIAALAPSREEIGGVARYLTGQMDKLGVKVCLGKEADINTVLENNPDVVVIATGSVPLVPALDGEHDIRVVSTWDVLQEKVEVGEKVVVVDGGEGFWPCVGAAEFLANMDKEVEIVSHLNFIGVEIPQPSFLPMQRRLAQTGVVSRPQTLVKRAEGNTLICANVYSGAEIEISGVDTVVMASYNKACDELFKSLKGKVKELYAVGDCVAPRRIPEAIKEGHHVARKI